MNWLLVLAIAIILLCLLLIVCCPCFFLPFVIYVSFLSPYLVLIRINSVLSCINLQAEDAVSRAADGSSAVQDLDFSSLRSQLGSLAAVSASDEDPVFLHSLS